MEKEAELLQRRSGLSEAKKALLQKRLLGSSEHEIRSASIPPRAPQSETHLSFAQQRLWFLDQLTPGNPFYNIPLLVRIEGPLDVSTLYRCLQELVQRHETLRTNFAMSGDNPVQIITPVRQIALPTIHLKAHNEHDRQLAVELLSHEEALRPFDLTHDLLMRSTLFRLTHQQHVLLITLHHIIADGWSLGILNQELAALYAAFIQGHPSPLPPLAIQYADYALWQLEWLQGQVLQKELPYWRQQLADLAPLELPLDHLRPPVQTFRGAVLPFSLSENLSQALLDVCKREGTTLFIALLSAFQMLLSRYSNQEDIAVGTPISGRTRAELEGLVGFFVNTLVMRTNLSGNPDSHVVLRRVKEVVLSAFQNQDVPFEKLVEDLQPERNLSRTPLIQTLFTLKVPTVNSQTIAQLTLHASEIESETSQFDLMLTMAEEKQKIIGHFQYNPDLFEASIIQQISIHFIALLRAIVDTPHLQLSEIPLLTREERQKVLFTWNDTLSAYPAHDCLHILFEQQVERTPDAMALIYEEEQLCYRELNQRVNQLARYLRNMGVAPEVLVGICMERSIEMVIALLGILKAGGAYVPLDPEYPSERLSYMLEDIATPIILTQHHLAAKLSTQHISIFCLDTERETLAQQSTDNPAHTITGSNLAYVIYTSGSTGKPKGAMNTHRGICNRLLWMQDAYQLTSADRVLQKTPYSFDVSVWEFFWPLLTGASLVMALPGGHRESGYLVSTILQQQITTLHFVPSMLTIFLEERGVEQCDSLRRVICSGEALAPEQQKRFFTLLDAHLYNLYGPTEAAVDVTAWTCQPTDEQTSVPIGQPIANTQIYLLDKHMQPVPVRVPGELYIGGMGLARGYLKQAQQTAEKFVPHPFSPEPGERLYRTGDLARYLPDGSIDYLGRLDFQVKLRGQRIELGEIEYILHHYEAVQQGVVLVHEESQGDKWLIAYIVVASGNELNAPELRRYLQTHLPQYMVPSQFITLDALPLTSNGKIDRRALAKLDVQSTEAREIVLPRTSIETQLVALWEEMLKHAPASIHDNFFEIGGHSLLATRMISRLRSSLGVELSLKRLFETPTIAGIADHVEQSLRGGQAVKTPIVPVSRTQPLPLSFAQQRLWFLDQVESEPATYMMPLAIRLQGKLQVSVLQRCLQEIVQRHEGLRTTFIALAIRPIQIIHDHMHIPIALINLQGLSGSQRLSLLPQFVEEEIQQPFNLSKDPLIRGKLLRLDEQEHILIIVMHHIISDAWSLGIIVYEFTALYAAFMQEKPSPLAPLPIQYADFAVWQHSWLQGEVLDSLTRYWKKQLRGATTLMLPTDRSLEQVKSSRGAKYIFTLPAALSQMLMTLSNQEGVTLFMTLLTAFQTLLYRYTGQTDSVIGTDIANRTHEESEKLIGFFVNLLVLRTDLSGKPSFRELLQRVRSMVLDAYAHQDLPFEKLVDELQLERTTQRTPLVNALFVLQNTPMPPLELPEMAISPLDIDPHSAKFALAAFMWEDAGVLVGLLNYRTDAFDAHTIETLARRFEALLHALVAQPDVAIDTLNIYYADELKQKEIKEESNHEMNRRKLKIARRGEIILAQGMRDTES